MFWEGQSLLLVCFHKCLFSLGSTCFHWVPYITDHISPILQWGWGGGGVAHTVHVILTQGLHYWTQCLYALTHTVSFLSFSADYV